MRDATTTPSRRARAAISSGLSKRATAAGSPWPGDVEPAEFSQQPHADDSIGACRSPIATNSTSPALVQRDQVLDVHLAHAADAERAESQPRAIQQLNLICRTPGCR